MEQTSCKVLYRGGQGEVVEKKSRFIASCKKIESEEEALAFIAEMKKKYWDARHNCFAYVLGERHQLQRCSDDGEPQGTAGRPMLDVLLKEDVHNLVVVVTRYFGGILLGTGGLVRAYQGAVQAGLKASEIIELQKGFPVSIQTDYNGLGKIQYLIASHGYLLTDAVYTEQVLLKTVVPVEEVDQLLEEITDGTGGAAVISRENAVDFAVIDGKIKIFKKYKKKLALWR